MLRKNDVITLTVTGYSSEGSGVGRHEAQAVFVNGAAAGDTIRCLIIKTKKNYAIGKIAEILSASPDRTVPDCPVFPRCGGCQLRHITYGAELALKRQRIEDAFRRIGHLDVSVGPVTALSPLYYRNKAQYPVAMANGRLLTGFYAPFSHRVVDCKHCLLQPPEFADILKTVCRWAEKYKIPVYDEETRQGLLRHIYLRKGFVTGEIMVCLVVNGPKLYKTDALLSALLQTNANIRTVVLNHNTADTNVILGEKNTVLYGDGYIEDELCGLRFRLSPHSFYQVNHDAAALLYRQARQFAVVEETDTLLDLYCGTGTIGLTMAKDVQTLIGAEIVPQAIEDAKENAKANGITNARFICADASDAAKQLRERGIKPDAVILDPPRKGCGEDVLRTVAGMEPKRIVYVSCDPATLARDCAALKELGYEVKEVAAFDLFPRTAHVETVALLRSE